MSIASPADVPLVVRPGHGLDAPIAELGAIHKVWSEVVDGRVAIVEYTLAPGRLAVPLHRHSREDELSFVVSGQMGAMLGDEVILAGAGVYVLKPRGQWHTFWNGGVAALRVLEIIAPGGLESFARRLSVMLSGPSPATVPAIRQAAAEYGIEFDFETVPAVCQQFGVSLAGWPES